MAISKEVYSQLKEQFWDVASWALWTPPKFGSKDNMGDLSVFDDPGLLDKLNSDYMFVALCGSGVHDAYVDKSKDWWNFHSSYPRGNDYRLRDATVGTPTQGSYITDFIKYHQEKDGKAAVKYFKSNREAREENLSALMKEIDMLGGDPIIFALGKDSFDLINEFIPDCFRVVFVPHYSGPVNGEIMRESILDGIKRYESK